MRMKHSFTFISTICVNTAISKLIIYILNRLFILMREREKERKRERER